MRSISPAKSSSICASCAAGLQPVRPRAVIPFLVPLQLQLQAQHLDVKLFGAEFLFFGAAPLFVGPLRFAFGPLRFAVALLKQRAHNRLQRFAVLG